MNRSFSETIQLCPDLADCFMQFHQCVWQQSHVPQGVLELCRLRIAQLLSAELDLSVRYKPTLACLSADKVSHLSRYYQSEKFSKLERNCIELAECFVLDPATITDEMASSVITHIGDAGYVALLEACGVFEGFTRFRLVLHCHTLNSEYVHQATQTEFVAMASKEKFKADGMRVKAADSTSDSMVRNCPLNLVPETLEAFLGFYQTLWLAVTCGLQSSRLAACVMPV